jgi:hypothetical protein
VATVEQSFKNSVESMPSIFLLGVNAFPRRLGHCD